MDLENINEKYHLKSKIQKRIITPKNFTYRILVSIINRYVSNGDKIMDLGSGVGTLDFYLASRGNLITSVDVSEIAIEMAKTNATALGVDKNIHYLRGDLSTISPNAKYGVILMTEVIEHLPNEDKILKSVKNILKKNGIFIISTRSSEAPLYKIGLAKFHDKRVGHLHRYNLYELEKKVVEQGFDIVEKGKTEGLLRDFLFSFPNLGSQVVRLANRFSLISDSLTFLDNIFLKSFGESQIYIVAKK